MKEITLIKITVASYFMLGLIIRLGVIETTDPITMAFHVFSDFIGICIISCAIYIVFMVQDMKFRVPERFFLLWLWEFTVLGLVACPFFKSIVFLCRIFI